MNKKELEEKLLKMEDQIIADCSDIYTFIWQNQEGQDSHFDNLTKSQKIAFIKLYSKVQELRSYLIGYNDWFIR